MSNFNRGDTVTVINPDLRTFGMTGRVESVSFGGTCVSIRFQNYLGADRLLYYKTENITKTGENQMAVQGNYKVAGVQFLNGYDTSKIYDFALFDENIEVNDCVLTDTQNGYQAAKVVNITDKNDAKSPTREIVCKLDFSAFNKRKETETRRKELKKRMDQEIKKVQEEILYETLAEKSPELAALLAEYQKLNTI